MYNNASYRQYSVFGINQPFSFSAAGPTVREQPAIMAWTGATVNQIEPDPGNDGIWFMGYKVTNPSAGVWHYEYAVYNQNLDRAIQSFSVPLGLGANISNIGFHAPPQQPGWAHDGTLGDAGYSSTPWNVTQDASSSLGARKLLRLIKMQTRFATPRYITSALTPINRRRLPTRQ